MHSTWARFQKVLDGVNATLPDRPMNALEKNSPAFERFRWSFFDDKDFWRDGLDRTALLQLEGEERKRAEGMLVDQLPDARGIIGLGELRSRRAEPQLIRLFNAESQAQRAAKRINDASWSPYKMVHLAKAWSAPLQPDRTITDD